jgi:hypothetical protein
MVIVVAILKTEQAMNIPKISQTELITLQNSFLQSQLLLFLGSVSISLILDASDDSRPNWLELSSE